jgi:dolichol-phosphate mannosyltransferase
MKITIIIPVYNEYNTIDKIVQKILNLKFLDIQLIIVDDCSNDGTVEKLKNLEIFKKINLIIYHSKNQGKGAAIKSAQKFIDGEIVLIQDADLEYHPHNYQKLLEPFLTQNAQIVYGSRVLGKKRYADGSGFVSKSRVFFNHFLTILSNVFNNQKLTDAHTCYKVFKSQIFKKINLEESDFAFCPEITSKISKLNIPIIEVPISYEGRTKKQGKKIGVKDGFRAIYVLFKYRFFSRNV